MRIILEELDKKLKWIWERGGGGEESEEGRS